MNKQYDFWFKLRCYYNAETELYDRVLTNKRSPYDNTEAWLSDCNQKTLSNQYALHLQNLCRDIASKQYRGMTDAKLFIEYFREPDKKYHFSAQGWIDMYNHLLEIGEMDFLEQKGNLQ